MFTFTLNMVGIVLACLHKFPYAEQHGAAMALGNIVAAVACRNELFLRCVFWIVVKVFQKVRVYLQPSCTEARADSCSLVDSPLGADLLDSFPPAHWGHSFRVRDR